LVGIWLVMDLRLPLERWRGKKQLRVCFLVSDVRGDERSNRTRCAKLANATGSGILPVHFNRRVMGSRRTADWSVQPGPIWAVKIRLDIELKISMPC
jgi:hypothetical protein